MKAITWTTNKCQVEVYDSGNMVCTRRKKTQAKNVYSVKRLIYTIVFCIKSTQKQHSYRNNFGLKYSKPLEYKHFTIPRRIFQISVTTFKPSRSEG